MKKQMSLDVKKFNRTFFKGLLVRLDSILQFEEFKLREFERKMSGSKHLNNTTYVKLRNFKLRKIKAIELLIKEYSDKGGANA